MNDTFTAALNRLLTDHVQTEAQRMAAAVSQLEKATGKTPEQLTQEGYSRLTAATGQVFLGIADQPQTWVPLPPVGLLVM